MVVSGVTVITRRVMISLTFIILSSTSDKRLERSRYTPP